MSAESSAGISILLILVSFDYFILFSILKGFSESMITSNISYESAKDEDIASSSRTPNKRKCRGKNLDWTRLKTFTTESEANSFLKEENIWARRFSNDCHDGEKVYYRCKQVPRRGTQCGANLYLLKSSTSLVCEIYTCGEHSHANIVVNPIKDDKIKSVILSMGKTGTKPAAILKYLKDQYPENRVPKITSIRNLLNRGSSNQKTENIVSIGEIIAWAETLQTVPEDVASPFILNYESSEQGASPKYFRFIMSSKQLLQNATKSNIIQTDATYKLIWNGFPVFVLGTTDKNKKFHLIAIGVSTNEKQEDFEFMISSLKASVEVNLKKTYKPSVLVSDAAPAIRNAFDVIFPDEKNIKVMCYYHVVANLQKQTRLDKSAKNWETMKSDIDHLHFAPSKSAFSKAQNLFIHKYSNEENFCNYFKRIWLDKNFEWFESIKHFTPSTNNGVEGFNSVLKRDFSFRKRLSVAKFTDLMKEVVESISGKYVDGTKIFESEQELSIKDWRAACEWVKLECPIFGIETENKNRLQLYVPSSTFDQKNKGEIFSEKHVNQYIHRSWKSFEQFKKNAFSVYLVNFNLKNWKKSSCSCPSFYKNYKCKHVTGIAINRKVIKPPQSANVDAIGEKIKRGRKPYAVKALLMD